MSSTPECDKAPSLEGIHVSAEGSLCVPHCTHACCGYVGRDFAPVLGVLQKRCGAVQVLVGCGVVEVLKVVAMHAVDNVPYVSASSQYRERKHPRMVREGDLHALPLPQAVIDPCLVISFRLAKGLGCEVTRLVIDPLVVDLAQQYQVVVAVDQASRTFAVTRSTWRPCRDVGLITDDSLTIHFRAVSDERPPAQRTPIP